MTIIMLISAIGFLMIVSYSLVRLIGGRRHKPVSPQNPCDPSYEIAPTVDRSGDFCWKVKILNPNNYRVTLNASYFPQSCFKTKELAEQYVKELVARIAKEKEHLALPATSYSKDGEEVI